MSLQALTEIALNASAIRALGNAALSSGGCVFTDLMDFHTSCVTWAHHRIPLGSVFARSPRLCSALLIVRPLPLVISFMRFTRLPPYLHTRFARTHTHTHARSHAHSQMAIATNFSFPPGAFTVEGFIKVAEGSGGRYVFSYNVVDNDNCTLLSPLS